jgi:GntR family transcriptional regulator
MGIIAQDWTQMVDDQQLRRTRSVGSTPLYSQIVERLRYQIVSGVYPPETQLPSEATLTRDFSVSRVTVRQALAELEKTGFIYRQQGRGTFVSGTHVRQQFSSGAQTIVEALRLQGITPIVKVVSLEHVKPDAEVAAALGNHDEEIVRLTRVFCNESIPIAQATLHLPLSMSGVAYLLVKNTENQTTYTILENSLGLVIKEAKHVIQTVALDERSASNLHMHAGDICLGMNRTTYSAQNTALEFTRLIYPPDRIRFEITLPRASSAQVLTMFSSEAAE